MKTEQSNVNSGIADGSSETDHFKELVYFGKGVNQYIIALADLAKAELVFALQTLPKLVMVSIIILPVAMLVWLTFSALIYWLVLSLTTSVTSGLVVLFLLQTIVLMGCLSLRRVYLNRLKFSNTREQIASFFSEISDHDTKINPKQK